MLLIFGLGFLGIAALVGLLLPVLVSCSNLAPGLRDGAVLACRAPEGDQTALHQPFRLADKKLGARVSDDQHIELRVHLAIQDEEALDKFVEEATDPNSPSFGQFMRPEEFAAKHLPKSEHLDTVDAYLRSHGVEATDRRGMVIHASGPAKSMESAFGAPLHEWTDNGETLHAPAAGMALPHSLGVTAVRGLATQARYKSRRKAAGRDWAPSPLKPADIRSGYNIPASATGAGAVLALVELDGYWAEDITAYCIDSNLRQIPRRVILIDGASSDPVSPDGQTECTMDIQLMNAMAPGAQELQVVIAPQASSHGFVDIINRLANPDKGVPLATHIGCSWGAPEATMSHAAVVAESKLYKQMRAQGQTLYAASGDSGARDDGRHIGTDDPASQPDVMGVGGTSLTLDKHGLWQKETTWASGGGGMSCFWGSPPWQKGLLTAHSLASDTWRNVPDVSLNADPSTGYRVYVNGRWVQVGGTSCAAPLWAAFGSLVEERRRAVGRVPLGFLPPHLYALASSPEGKVCFHDISDNSSNGYYPAVEGLDDATGWGSFDGTMLLLGLETYGAK